MIPFDVDLALRYAINDLTPGEVFKWKMDAYGFNMCLCLCVGGELRIVDNYIDTPMQQLGYLVDGKVWKFNYTKKMGEIVRRHHAHEGIRAVKCATVDVVEEIIAPGELVLVRAAGAPTYSFNFSQLTQNNRLEGPIEHVKRGTMGLALSTLSLSLNHVQTTDKKPVTISYVLTLFFAPTPVIGWVLLNTIRKFKGVAP